MKDKERCEILELNKKNINGRIYSVGMLAKIIKDFGAGGLLVYLDGKDFNNLTYDEVTHEAYNLKIEGNKLVATLKIVPTSKHFSLVESLEKENFEISACGYGYVNETGKVTDYRLTHISISPKHRKALIG